MALLKSVPTEYGVTVSYHKIVLTNIDWLARKAHIEIVGYKDQQARLDGCKFLVGTGFDFQGDNFDFTCEDNIVAKSYEKLVLLPEFESALAI
jgi:hypothetical protein